MAATKQTQKHWYKVKIRAKELRKTQTLKEQDAFRTAQLEAVGNRVLRIWNEEVEANPEGVLQKIAAACGTLALLLDLGEGPADIRPPG